jgi:flagellar biosynthetic protein FliO
MNMLLKKTFLISLAALALLMMLPEARAAVTDQDIATLNLTTGTVHQAASLDRLSMTWVLGRLALSLGVVFGLMWAALWAAKKYLPQGAKNTRGGMIEVLSNRALGQRRSLILVRTMGKTLLLGVTPGSIQTLAELEPDAEHGSWQDAALEAGLK